MVRVTDTNLKTAAISKSKAVSLEQSPLNTRTENTSEPSQIVSFPSTSVLTRQSVVLPDCAQS